MHSILTRPLRVLLTTNPTPGEFWPLVALGWAFRAAGHDVQVAGLANIVPDITASGLPALEAGEPVNLYRLFGDDSNEHEQGFLAQAGDMRRLIRWNMRAANMLVDEVLARLRSRQPDLVIHAPMDLAGPLVAGLLGVPAILHQLGLPLRPLVADGMHRGCLALQTRYGVPGDFGEPMMILDVCPPGFGKPQQCPTVQPMRYTPYTGSGEVPAWVGEPAAAPVVCVTASVEPPGEVAVPYLADVARAVAGDDVEVLLPLPEAVLSEIDQATLPGVRLTRWFPLQYAAAGCAAVVHRGESESVLTFMASGVPQVVVPSTHAEQRNAEALQAAAAGVTVPAEKPAADVASAVQELLADPACRQAAQHLAAEMLAMPAPAQVVARAEKLMGDIP
jgi:UDP:flavonoid glycosyltransferase YjiC (YdhE family)